MRLRSFVIFATVTLCAFSSFGASRQTFLAPPSPHAGNTFKVAFFDADSTLRISKLGSVSANSPTDYIILPGVAEGIKNLNAKGYLVAIVSNQAGIPQHISLEDADAALFNMIHDLKSMGATVHYYDFAENDDDFRKPKTGMATRLESNIQSQFGSDKSIDKASSLMVGDSAYRKARNGKPGDTRPDGRPGFNFSNSDRLFAENYGITFLEPQDFFGWKQYGVELIENQSQLDTLLKAMETAPH